MKLHEYQAKQLFTTAGIPIPRGEVATDPAWAAHAYTTLRQRCGTVGVLSCNVKAQLHAGGRGKAGGILVARSASEAATCAASLIGRRLVTHQTGPSGLPVSAVLLEERIAVARELYVALTLDRFRARLILLASRRGGVDIEDLAASDPGALLREPVDLCDGPTPDVQARAAKALGCHGAEQAKGVAQIVQAVWTLCGRTEASLVEINPLVVTQDGRLLALDAKMSVDDNALFRHPDLAALRDERQEHPLEVQANRAGVAYVGLDGTIGCLVNGAGLAMATNDIIKLCGGEPANFLDVGGGASVEQVTKAFDILLADPRIKAVLVNIFGGIMRCDWIAEGLLKAAATRNVQVPIVVRLQGTNVEQGRRLLAKAKRLNLISAEELEDAARKAVELASQTK